MDSSAKSVLGCVGGVVGRWDCRSLRFTYILPIQPKRTRVPSCWFLVWPLSYISYAMHLDSHI